jgi:hypothetical protein
MFQPELVVRESSRRVNAAGTAESPVDTMNAVARDPEGER